MIVPFVDDPRNLTEASGTRFVERRFLNRRIVFQKHAFDGGAFETTVFGKSVPFTGTIAGLLEFVATVLFGFTTVLDGMRIQNAKSIREAVVGQFDIPWLVDIRFVGEFVPNLGFLTRLMLFTKERAFYDGISARIFVGVFRTLTQRNILFFFGFIKESEQAPPLHVAS